MKRCAVIVLLLLVVVSPLWASLSDSGALSKAKGLFGPTAVIRKVRQFGDSNWTTEVGFASRGCRNDPTIMGRGFNTWDDAFAHIQAVLLTPTISGVKVLHAEYSTDPNDDPLMAATTGIQWLMDGANLGNVVPIGPVPWMSDMSWDTSTVTNGFHAICASMIHGDGSRAPTHAEMVNVLNAI